MGGRGATVQTKVEHTISPGIAIAKGDKFTIKGIESDNEHARFDFISFVPVGNVESKPPITQVAPTITTSGFVTIAENQTVILNINSTDVNGDNEGKGLRYSLIGGVDQSVFKINPNNGALSFISAPDLSLIHI